MTSSAFFEQDDDVTSSQSARMTSNEVSDLGNSPNI